MSIENKLKELLVGARVVRAKNHLLELDNGIELSLYMSDSDCCACALGDWFAEDLEAGITNVKVSEPEEYDSGDSYGAVATITILHQDKTLARAEMDADAGNGGYYFSVLSLEARVGEDILLDEPILSSMGD